MVFMRSQVFCGVFVSAFVVLFCVDLACRAEGDVILKLANIGDDIALGCSRPDGLVDNYKWWYRNGTLIANWDGFLINDTRFIQSYNTEGGRADSNNIFISNIRMNDSATFQCFGYHNDTLESYELRVIRCSKCITTSHSNPNKTKVICTLDNYWTKQALSRNITLNGNIYRTALFQGRTFSFPISVRKLNSLHSKFRLQTETESAGITCMLSTEPTSPSSSTTTLPTTSSKQTTQTRPSTLSYTAFKKTLPIGRRTSISTTIHHTPTNKTANSDKRTTTRTTTSLKQTTQNRPSTLQYTASERLPVGRPTSPNTNSDKIKRDGNITMIVVILGSAVILILIVIIIVLRRKQMSDRQENKDIPNASIKQEHPEVCYESVEDGSLKDSEYATSNKELRGTRLDPRRAHLTENGEMIDDILYDSADNIDDSSITRIEGPLDNALYTMPDKRAAISREPKSKSDHLYGNSVIITQHWHNRDTLQQGDQYKNVKLPGSGDDAEEIPLYDMPDKGFMRNTLKATPEAGQTLTLSKDEVVRVDALYAKVDKTK